MLTGTVFYDGEPVPNARLLLTGSGDQNANRKITHDCDEHGRIRVQITADTYVVTALIRVGQESRTVHLVEALALEAGQAVERRLEFVKKPAAK